LAQVLDALSQIHLRQRATPPLSKKPQEGDLPIVIREGIEEDGDSKITDLHIWQVGAGKFAAIVCVVAHDPKTPQEYRATLKAHEELVHVTVEVQVCSDEPHIRRA
jgi:Co/Zn/Cd efflux system component